MYVFDLHQKDGGTHRRANRAAHHLRHVQGRGPGHDYHRRARAGKARREVRELRKQLIFINFLE